MFKNSEELFEKDDWLEKQRELESRISAWDFDDAKKLASEHEYMHSRRQAVNYRATGEKTFDQKGFGFGFALNMIALSMLIVIATVANNVYFNIALFVLILGVISGIVIFASLFKKFPPDIYWYALFAIVLSLIFYGLRPFINYLLWRYLG